MGNTMHSSTDGIPVHKVRTLIGRSIIQQHDVYFDHDREPDDITPESNEDISLSTLYLYEGLANFNGSIDFDLWLNLSSTTWTKAFIVRSVLKKPRMLTYEYLKCIGQPGTNATRGLMMGKIDSMGALCLLREIHNKSKYNTEIRS